MADWFKFYNDGLDSKGMQFALSEQPLVTSVWLVILSEASKNRASEIPWSGQDFEIIGYARKINVPVAVFNQSIDLLAKVGYIVVGDGSIKIPGWESLQSTYAKGVDRGYYKNANKSLVSTKQVSTPRGEERRGEEKRREESTKTPKVAVAPVADLIPLNLETEAFREAWSRWHDHLKAKRKPATPHARDLQLRSMAEMGEARAIAAINHSIRNNWQGIYEPNQRNGFGNNEKLITPVRGSSAVGGF
jgi:hypothetical protein